MAGWHESHEICRRAAASALIPSHALVEAYSVLTRIPPPYRLSPDIAAGLLMGFFGKERILYPPKKLMGGIVETCGAAGIAGGSVYDALIARIASEHGAPLLTLDRRAIKTYDRLGVATELLGT